MYSIREKLPFLNGSFRKDFLCKNSSNGQAGITLGVIPWTIHIFSCWPYLSFLAHCNSTYLIGFWEIKETPKFSNKIHFELVITYKKFLKKKELYFVYRKRKKKKGGLIYYQNGSKMMRILGLVQLSVVGILFYGYCLCYSIILGFSLFFCLNGRLPGGRKVGIPSLGILPHVLGWHWW